MKTSFRIRTLLMALTLFTAIAACAQVPLLNSHPSSPAVVYLDFDGQTVSGTSWNSSGPIVCGAAGLDNSNIDEIFNRVAEDYRPFDLNITTDSIRYLAAPVTQRMRVIITVSSAWYGPAGGVSFVGSFAWGDNTPCFVFSQLLNFQTKNVAEAISHEVGHTLGLYHQSSYDASCNKLSDYNAGQGSGEIGWAPIMGVGYYRNFTLWNNGPNSYGCSNYQSDLDIITTNNGFGYRADDVGNSFETAANVSFFENQFGLSGVIERNTDFDMFVFTLSSSGRFQLDAIPYHVGSDNAGSDLDLQVTLYNAAGTALNVYNPGALLSSVIDTNLNAGLYYLRVEGKGNQFAPAYAILGSYSLLATATTGTTLAIRKLELRGLPSGDRHLFNWTIETAEALADQSLEISKDGRNFHTLASPGTADRSFAYRTEPHAAAWYRLAVRLANNQPVYSNVVFINSAADPHPELSSTLLSSALTVTSPGSFQYVFMNAAGQVLKTGRLQAGTNPLALPAEHSGIYLLRIADAGRQWSYQLVRP